MNEHPNASIVRSAHEAMGSGDVTDFAEFLDDGITRHESTPGYEAITTDATMCRHFSAGSCRRPVHR